VFSVAILFQHQGLLLQASCLKSPLQQLFLLLALSHLLSEALTIIDGEPGLVNLLARVYRCVLNLSRGRQRFFVLMVAFSRGAICFGSPERTVFYFLSRVRQWETHWTLARRFSC